MPSLEHRTIFGDPILTLGGALEAVRIDVLEPNEHLFAPGEGSFLNETRNFMSKRVDLDREVDFELLPAPQCDDAVENLFPIAIAREIVVAQKERLGSLREVLSD